MPWLTTTTLPNYYRPALINDLSDQLDGVVNTMLASSKETIEAYLSRNEQFTAPLRDDEVSPLLEKVQADLTLWHLFQRTGAEVPESIAVARNDAVAVLNAIQAGDITILRSDEGKLNAELGYRWRMPRSHEIDWWAPSVTEFFGGPRVHGPRWGARGIRGHF